MAELRKVDARERESIWPSLNSLDEKQLAAFRRFANGRSDFREISPLFYDGTSLEEPFTQMAAAYVMFDARPLDKKLQQVSGYNSQSLKGFRKKVLDLASEIERLNTLPLPGAATALELIWELGREDISNFYAAGTESIQEFVLDIERIPNLLRGFAETLRSWPHPSYRTRFSDRNWEARPLAMLCAVVDSVHQDPHFEEIAVLLTLMKDFAVQALHRPPIRRGRPAEGYPAVSIWQPGAVVDAASVKRTLVNFQRRNPDVWSLIQRRAATVAQRRLDELTPRKGTSEATAILAETKASK